MTETNIRLIYHSETKDWTVIIDGIAHEHLSGPAAEALMEYTMVVAEQTEARAGEREGDIETNDNDPPATALPN